MEQPRASTAGCAAPDVSIVIVSWNTREILAECLTAVAGSRYPSALDDRGCVVLDGLACEVLVVDNASHDGTSDMVRADFPWVQLIANQENLGFARANNQAFRVSRGRYVLMLNPDTRPEPGALRVLVDFMESHPRAGAAGARIVNSDGSLQVSCYPAPTLAREMWRLFHLDRVHAFGSYDMQRWPMDGERRSDTILGACMLIPWRALAEVGPLDEDFFIYSEEVDLCQRLREHGWDVYWVPEAVVMHHGGESTRQVATDMFLKLYAAKVLYFRKHQGGVAARIYKLILTAAAFTRIAFAPVCHARGGDVLADRYRRLVKALPAF